MGLGVIEIPGPAEAVSERARLASAVLKSAADGVTVNSTTLRTLAGNLAVVTFHYDRSGGAGATEKLILPTPCRLICVADTALDTVGSVVVTWKFIRGAASGTPVSFAKSTRAVGVTVGATAIGGVNAATDAHMLLLPGDRVFADIGASAKGIASLFVILV